MGNSEEIARWRNNIFNTVVENIQRTGSLTPMVVVLHKDSESGKFESRPFMINMRDASNIATSIIRALNISNAIAYIAFAEAKINIYPKSKIGEVERELKENGNQLSLLKNTEDAVVITTETLFTNEVEVYQVIKDNGNTVMSRNPVQDVSLSGNFLLMSNFLKLPTIEDQNNL